MSTSNKKAPKNEGQILVLMALLSTTMVILFGMVVSIGHLVQAKINLQNAVDLAAMSGASWQARFLNGAAFVNYRLRQNYKFFLYDIYVTQSRYNAGLVPRQVNVFGGPYDTFDRVPKSQTAFGICQQAYGYTPKIGVDCTGGGIACQAVADDTDLCRMVWGEGGRGQQIPPIIPSPTPNLNPILIAANIAIAALSQRVRDLCNAASGQNQEYFYYATQQLEKRQRYQVLEMLRQLTEFDKAFSKDDDIFGGQGVADQTIVKTFRTNLIAANNVGTLKLEYLNPSKTRAFRNEGADADTITTKIFDTNPPQGTFGEYFERQKVIPQTYAADFGPTCSTQVIPVVAQKASIVGLSRTRNHSQVNDPVKIPLSVVIKASVTPRLLFWPRTLTPTLVAIGAAKPFGGRIGPPLSLTNYEVSGVRNNQAENNNAAFANMSFYPGDAGTPSDADPNLTGIGHKRILQYLFRELPKPNFGPGSGRNELRPSIEQPPGAVNCVASSSPPFMCLSLAPTLYEGLFWTVFPFPTTLYSKNESLTSDFPWDTFNSSKVADANDYFLPDRMGSLNPSTTELLKWHHSVLIGKTQYFRDPSTNQPVFFADAVSSNSSWSAELQYDASDLNPAAGASDTVDVKGRLGYQIKLSSVASVCREITEGGVEGLGKLQALCQTGNTKVHH